MKKFTLPFLLLLSVAFTTHATDEHVFSCTDANNSPAIEAVNPASTHFTWNKNGTKIFDRTFTDGYSRSRNAYITFFCSKNIISYQLYPCGTAGTEKVCPVTEDEAINIDEENSGNGTTSSKSEMTTKLNIDQRKVSTGATLVDGDDYRFVSHYIFTSSTGNNIFLNGLYFVTEVDEKNYVSTTESTAAAQYEYVLLGPEGELVSGVTTNDGRLYFDLRATPISVGVNDTNVGIGAKAKGGIEDSVNSSIRWVLNQALGEKGIVASSQGRAVTANEINVTASRPGVFSRGAAGLKMSHFNPQEPLFEPSLSAQPFYRMQIENISPSSSAAFARGSLDARLLGMQKQDGADLQASDISLAELDTAGNVLRSLPAQITRIETEHHDNKSISFRFDINNFVIPSDSRRIIEFRVANTVNDENRENNDDGLAIAMKTASFPDGSKYSLSDLATANWVWSDLSNPGSDWRSGINLALRFSALVMKE